MAAGLMAFATSDTSCLTNRWSPRPLPAWERGGAPVRSEGGPGCFPSLASLLVVGRESAHGTTAGERVHRVWKSLPRRSVRHPCAPVGRDYRIHSTTHGLRSPRPPKVKCGEYTRHRSWRLAMTRRRRGRSIRDWSRFIGVREKSTFEERIERKKRRYQEKLRRASPS